MKNLLLLLTFLTASVAYGQEPSLTVTQTPTAVDENGESISGPETFKMEIRNWPINDPIYVRIKLGSVPNAGGETDWFKLAETEFQITGPSSTNAAGFITVTNQEAGDVVTYNGVEKQGYNLDLEWSSWSEGAVGPWFGDAMPTTDGQDLIVGGAGFWDFQFTADAAVDVLGAEVMSYNTPVVEGATPSFTVTQTPTAVDENGESISGPESFKMEVRNWPINDPIYVRIKLGSVPNAGGDTDWFKLADTEFQITGPASTNAAAFITVSNQEEGEIVTYNGVEKQGYNLDLEWSSWSQGTVGPWFGDAMPMTDGEDLIVGGAGFWDFQFTADAAVDVLGAEVMSYNVPVITSTEDFEFANVKIFPNPTNGLINITGLENAEYIAIYNVIGQEVKRLAGVEQTLDISGLNEGVYVLKSDNGLLRKIIKK